MTPIGDLLRPASRRVPGRSLALASFAALALLCGAYIFAVQAEPAAVEPPAALSAPSPAPADTTAVEHRIIAYYFHTTRRCVSCLRIEAYSHEAIEAAFQKDLQAGRLVWRLVNVEEKANEHFVEDYQLFTKSLVLVEEAGGRQVRWKNLAKVWELLPQKDRFSRYVQDEVRAYLGAKS